MKLDLLGREDMELFKFVCAWMTNESINLDKNQIKSGWPCILKMYLKQSSIHWPMDIPDFSHITGYVVHQVVTGEEMQHLSQLMHNCLDTMIIECSLNQSRIFTVLKQDSETPIAIIGLVTPQLINTSFGLHHFTSSWIIQGVLGKSNTKVDDIFNHIADDIKNIMNSDQKVLKDYNKPPLASFPNKEKLNTTLFGQYPGHNIILESPGVNAN
jgi:hypothetical protein